MDNYTIQFNGIEETDDQVASPPSFLLILTFCCKASQSICNFSFDRFAGISNGLPRTSPFSLLNCTKMCLSTGVESSTMPSGSITFN